VSFDVRIGIAVEAAVRANDHDRSSVQLRPQAPNLAPRGTRMPVPLRQPEGERIGAEL
jgi:hypothetical protein